MCLGDVGGDAACDLVVLMSGFTRRVCCGALAVTGVVDAEMAVPRGLWAQSAKYRLIYIYIFIYFLLLTKSTNAVKL